MDAGEVEIVVPSEAIRPFVRRYLYANRRLDAPVTVQPKPTGYSYFLNNFGLSSSDFAGPGGEPRPAHSLVAVVDGRDVPFLSRWHISGQIMDHAIEVRFSDRLQIVFCELAASALSRLFGIPGARMTGLSQPLPAVAPHVKARARAHFVCGPEASREEHVAEANAFFLALAERAGPGDPIVEAAVARFEAANGAVRVADICKQLDVNPRRLN